MQTDDELVGELRKGSEEAFNLLYQRYSSSLLRHIMCVLKSKDEAEEVLHECFILMLQKINFYQPRTELQQSFKAWLYRLATNRAIDELRKKKSPGDLRVSEVQTSAEIDYVVKEESSLFAKLFESLPPVQRTLLGLRVHEDLSYQEISVIVGKDINAVKQGLFQAKKTLKDLLAKNGELL